MAVIVDTSAIVALANARDQAHAPVADFVSRTREPLVLPISILAEVDYLLVAHAGEHVARAFVRSLVAGELVVDHLTAADLARASELMDAYADSFLGFVDASVIALAERLRAPRILTLDRRHFQFVRPRHCAAFEVVP